MKHMNRLKEKLTKLRELPYREYWNDIVDLVLGLLMMTWIGILIVYDHISEWVVKKIEQKRTKKLWEDFHNDEDRSDV